MSDKLQRISDYPAYLEARWQEHLASRADDAPTVISTFAGCGGSSLGYSMAGFRELLAVEWDDNAVKTFKLNFPDVPVYHGDIARLSVAQCLEMTNLLPGQLDVLDGSPPCQGFSITGKREFDDERNQLFREYVRLLRGLHPKVFVMENVSGMVKGKMKLIFAEILRELKASGYQVSARLLDAVYFGVPQFRERLIFIGVRDDLKIMPSHPAAQTIPITVGEAWQEVRDENAPHLSPKLASFIGKIPVWGDGGDVFRNRTHFSTVRLDMQRPSRTLTKNSYGSFACHVHPNGQRAITTAEAKRIASFPDSYQFPGNYKESIECMGNCVPPLFMRAIARHIRSEILSRVMNNAE